MTDSNTVDAARNACQRVHGEPKTKVLALDSTHLTTSPFWVISTASRSAADPVQWHAQSLTG